MDGRDYWVYEGGWLAKTRDGSWYELNEDSYRNNDGKPCVFEENKRTRAFVELYDQARKVSVRLSETDLKARWDHEGEDADWKTYYEGRWKKRE